MFLKLHPAPVLIDEVQYAPELFSHIKIAVDNGAAPGSYWLTCSQAYRLMELAQESLAGRTAILHMSALSQADCGAVEVSPFRWSLTNCRSARLCFPLPHRMRYTSGFGTARPGHRSGKYKARMCFTAAIFRPISTGM